MKEKALQLLCFIILYGNIPSSGQSKIVFEYDSNGNQISHIIEGSMSELAMEAGVFYTMKPDTLVLKPGNGFDSYLWQDNSTDSIFQVSDYGEYSVLLTSGECSISVVYKVDAALFDNIYSISIEHNGNGIVKGSATQVYHGGELMLTIKPNEQFQIDSIFVNDIYNNPAEYLHIVDITEDKNIRVVFGKKQCYLTFTTHNYCTINPNLSSMDMGSSQVFTISPHEGYEILDVIINKDTVGSDDSFEITSIDTNYVIEVLCNLKSYLINTEGDEHVTITPMNPIVQYGQNQAFEFIADNEYYISNLILDGQELEPLKTITLTNIKSAHTLIVNADIGTSIQNTESISSLIYYPNPLKDILKIKGVNSACSVSVIDMSGKLIIEQELRNNEIDLSGLLTGNYLIRINTPNYKKKIFMIIKE